MNTVRITLACANPQSMLWVGQTSQLTPELWVTACPTLQAAAIVSAYWTRLYRPYRQKPRIEWRIASTDGRWINTLSQ